MWGDSGDFRSFMHSKYSTDIRPKEINRKGAIKSFACPFHPSSLEIADALDIPVRSNLDKSRLVIEAIAIV